MNGAERAVPLFLLRESYRVQLFVKGEEDPCLLHELTTGRLCGYEQACWRTLLIEGAQSMARSLDWSQCPAVESVPGRLSGAWVFRDTRMPVSAVFENIEVGASIEEIIDQFAITREQIVAVLEFAARSLDAPHSMPPPTQMADARSL